MPTFNRRIFVSQAMVYFKRQDYAAKELIIIDDGDDCVADLVPDDPTIRSIRLKKKTAARCQAQPGLPSCTGLIDLSLG